MNGDVKNKKAATYYKSIEQHSINEINALVNRLPDSYQKCALEMAVESYPLPVNGAAKSYSKNEEDMSIPVLLVILRGVIADLPDSEAKKALESALLEYILVFKPLNDFINITTG